MYEKLVWGAADPYQQILSVAGLIAMITTECVLSEQNQKLALSFFESKEQTGNGDMSPAKMKELWETGKDDICARIRDCSYEASTATEYVIVNGKGKKRTITQLAPIDRFITRLISQVFNDYYDMSSLEDIVLI